MREVMWQRRLVSSILISCPMGSLYSQVLLGFSPGSFSDRTIIGRFGQVNFGPELELKRSVRPICDLGLGG